MKPIPLIRASQLNPFLTFLERIGAPINKLIDKSKIPDTALTTPEQWLPEYQVWDFIERAGRANGSAIEFGLWTGLTGDFGFLKDLMYPALTPKDALVRFCLLTKLHSSQARFWLAEQAAVVWFCRQGIDSIGIGQQGVECYTLMLMINVVRWSIGVADWHPSKIYVQMARSPILERFSPLTNTEIQYGKEITAIAIEPWLLSRPIKQESFSQISQPTQIDSLQKFPLATDFVSSLRQVIEPQLRENYPNLELIAQISGLSSRTLQRRLTEAGLTYTYLLNQIQFERARSMLQEPNIKLKDISDELGYSTQAHFTRAFKRWTGVTPNAFRELCLS